MRRKGEGRICPTSGTAPRTGEAEEAYSEFLCPHWRSPCIGERDTRRPCCVSVRADCIAMRSGRVDHPVRKLLLEVSIR